MIDRFPRGLLLRTSCFIPGEFGKVPKQMGELLDVLRVDASRDRRPL